MAACLQSHREQMPCVLGLCTHRLIASYVSIHRVDSKLLCGMHFFTLHIGPWMTQAPLLEVKAGRRLVLKSGAHISHKELPWLTGSSSLSAFLTLQIDIFVEGKWDNALEVCSSILVETEKQNITVFQKIAFMGEGEYGSWYVYIMMYRNGWCLSVTYSFLTQINSPSHTYTESMSFVLEETADLANFSSVEKDCIFLWNNTLPYSLSECGLLLSLLDNLHSAFSPGGWSCCQERAATKHRNCMLGPILGHMGN